jgi:hypothetical protein
MNHIENTVSIVIVQPYLDRCIQTVVCLSAHCIATAALAVLLEVSAQQRFYTPHNISKALHAFVQLFYKGQI